MLSPTVSGGRPLQPATAKVKMIDATRLRVRAVGYLRQSDGVPVTIQSFSPDRIGNLADSDVLQALRPNVTPTPFVSIARYPPGECSGSGPCQAASRGLFHILLFPTDL